MRILLAMWLLAGLGAELGQQVGGVHGFGENLELVAQGAGLLEEIRGGGLSGEEENLAVGHLGAGRDGGLDAGHSGHDDVGDEHVGLEAVEALDGLLATVDGAGFEAGLVENDGESVGDHLFIVGDEYAWLGRCGGCDF